jgi:hypothetical protein
MFVCEPHGFLGKSQSLTIEQVSDKSNSQEIYQDSKRYIRLSTSLGKKYLFFLLFK